MRSRPPSPEHQAALSRRLALLGQELAPVRPREVAGPTPLPGQPTRPWWDDHTRLAEGGRRREPAPEQMPPAVQASGVAPGRHAARRPPPRAEAAGDDRGLGREAEPLTGAAATDLAFRRGRLLLGPAQLAVVATVVIMALGVTCWWLARGRPSDTVELQSAPAATLVTSARSVGVGAEPSAAAAAAVPVAAASASSPAATVTVDVSGRVRHPGIQVLQPGARIADALTAAGGAGPGVDLTALNLAQVLVDGQQVLVGASSDGTSSVTGSPSTGSVSTPGATASPGTDATPTQVVDLNTASADQLDTLPDVGPVTAQSILSWRAAHGRFSSVDELLEVDGIGEVTLGKIAPYVTV